MTKIHEIHDLNNATVIDILKHGLSEVVHDSIIKNYHPDYNNIPGNLFYILDQGRYRRGHGKYFVITDDYDKYVCSAGWNEYDLNPSVALLLTRMYITPAFRAQYIIGNTILPGMIQEAINYSKLWVTVNDHNHSIYKYFQRVSQNKRTALFNDWPDIYKRFKPIGKHTIYYTEQWTAEYDKQTNN
jgi:hypothetical protein